MPTILIIEDEKDILEAIEYNLKKESFLVTRALNGQEGLDLARRKRPDLILLDLMLPIMDGLEVCKALKKDSSTSHIPIIMVTAKAEEVDKILGLELGADDYLTKPFSMRELIARIKAVLKRSQPEKDKKTLNFPGLEIDPEKHEVKIRDKEVTLTAKEFSLLYYLAENKGRVVNREKLLDKVWGVEVALETRTVDVHIKRLREKLGSKAGSYIETLRGVGYKFKDA